MSDRREAKNATSIDQENHSQPVMPPKQNQPTSPYLPVPGQEETQTSSPGLPLAVVWCLPFFAYLLAPMAYFTLFPIETPWDTPAEQVATLKSSDPSWLYAVGAQVVVTGILIAIGFKSYLQSFSLKIHPASLLLGLIGCFLWVSICWLDLERLAANLFFGTDDWIPNRPGINPWEVFPDSPQRLIFLTLRFTGLALLIPIAEEVFLRGFLLRVMEGGNWEEISMKSLPWRAVLVAGAYGVLAHPGEAIAAFIWFAGVSLWVRKTGNFWDAVTIHVVTNLTLGIYLCTYSQWHLW